MMTNKHRLMNIDQKLDMAADDQNRIFSDLSKQLIEERLLVSKRLDFMDQTLATLIETNKQLSERMNRIESLLDRTEQKSEQSIQTYKELDQATQQSLKDLSIVFQEMLSDYYSNINDIIRVFAANAVIDSIPCTEQITDKKE